MGVPKFYRWISERYPKINEIVSDSALLPEFDHLYLDMNGIIHGCTHPSHLDVSDVLSERDMMLGIMHYLDRIISQIVKPKVSLYMAIDGVAPRAKLNQQRSRRFRSAKDMADATKDLEKKQRNSNDDEDKDSGGGIFDSNCITPGTEFMARVSDTIKYFIRQKIKQDPLWRNLTVIFSGHEIPGEGEHKIMDHIRQMKSNPNYQPNTRHCIYGQDADLIMLGLVTHEPHFTILREVVDFSGGFSNNRNALKTVKKQVKEADFQLLHLSVLREYLQIEFCNTDLTQPTAPTPPSATSPNELEHIIDDFVFMTFLVGNDFLPHLNTLDIGDGAFDLLFNVYKQQRLAWGDKNIPTSYLTHCGNIQDPTRLETFLAAIGSVETEILEQREIDDAAYVKKKRKWNKRDGKDEGPSDAELAAAESEKQNDYLTMMEQLMAKHGNDPSSVVFVDGWKPVEAGEKDFKGRYYYEKLKLTPVDIAEHKKLRKAYMEGLMWCLAYYYRGCISWGWFYPYHYGPMLSDLTNLPRMFEEIKFELGAPLKPFQQLMGCLPPASSILVPKPYRELMTSPQSPIVGFYPIDFKVDMNGKKNPWEGVNLLPWIDVNLLKDSIAKFCPDSKLTAAEKERNARGKVYLYTHDLTCTETIDSPNKKIGLADITNCHSRVTILDEPDLEGLTFKPELIPNTQIPYPGFPSLNVLPIASVELVPIGLNCFGFPSKYPNMVLRLHDMPPMPSVEVLADTVLGRSLFINWPLMHEAKVVAISDETSEVRMNKDSKKKVKKFNKVEEERWATDSQLMMEGYFKGTGVPGSGGCQIGDIKFRLKLLPLQGMKTNPANGSTKKLFGREEADVPLQLALLQAPAPDPRFVEKGPMKLEDRFPPNCNVVLTKGKYRGCKGTVVGVAEAKKVGVKVQVMPPEIPFGLALARTVYESYIPSVDAARILKLHPGLFGKITGSLLFEPGNYDLGLNLKSSDGLCVAGFTRQKKDSFPSNGGGKKNAGKKAWDSGDSLLVIGSSRTSGGDGDEPAERLQWEYTPKAIHLINQYRQKYPQLFDALVRQPNERKYDASKVFGPNGADWLPLIREYLNNVESAKLPRTPISTETMSREAVSAVERASDVRNLALKRSGHPKESLIKIPGSALYRESSTGATDVMLASDHNNSEAPEIGDRIVNLCASGIPFGARGTVIGIHKATTGCVEVVMDEEFVGGTSLQGACSNFRGKLCVWAHLLKISVENSKSMVDKLVPKGSGQAAVDKILSTMAGGAVPNGAPAANTAAGNTPSAPPPPVISQPKAPQSYSRAASQGRSGSAGRLRAGANRTASTGRGKQAGWKEAVGPPEKGIGFKGSRKSGKSGLSRWKGLMTSGKNVRRPTPQRNKAAELKAMLGVSASAAVPPPSQPQATTVQQSTGDAAAGLKSLLGVGSAPAPAPPPPVQQSASAGLKSLLGVGSAPAPSQPPAVQEPPMPPPPTMDDFPPPPPPPPQPQAAPSAADKLLQLMAQKQPQPGQGRPPMGAPTPFNFTYVEEGKEVPIPAPPPQPQQPPMHMMMPPHPGMMPPQMAHFGMPPPPPPPMHMMMHPPHPGMIPPQMPPHPMVMPLPPAQFMPPQQQQQQQQHHNRKGPNPNQGGPPPPPVFKDEEFPALGSSPPKLVPEQAPAPVKAPDAPAPAPEANKAAQGNMFVPSAVASKGKK